MFRLPLKTSYGSWPGAIVVKFPCSTSVALGLRVQIPGVDLHTTHQAMLWLCPTYKIKEQWHRCQLRDNLPYQKTNKPGPNPWVCVLYFGSLRFDNSNPGHGPTHHLSHHAVAASHIQNRGRLAQMSAQ